METALVLKIIDVAIVHGIPAVQQLIKTYNKGTITEEDWDELVTNFEKSPDDYIKEAEKNAGKS